MSNEVDVEILTGCGGCLFMAAVILAGLVIFFGGAILILKALF